MSDLEDRLKTWFAGEVSRAERDLASSKVGTARLLRRRTAIPGLALAALMVSLVVAAVTLRPSVAPDTGKGPVRSPATTPLSGRTTVFGADGMPTVVDGEPVLRVPEAQVRLSATRPTRLLVGGWYSLVMMRCAAAINRPESPLLPYCNPARLSADPEHVQAGLSVVPDGVPTSVGWVVLRVHTGDPRAFSCSASLRAQCEKAIVVEEVVWQNPLPPDPMAGRYPDGIPSEIAGETVIRPKDVRGVDVAPGDPFLLGGWSPTLAWRPCIDGQRGGICGGWSVSETPAGSGDPGTESIGLRAGQPIPWGPVVLRVRAGDPVPPGCPDGAMCIYPLAAPLVEDVVWAGDDVTRTAPLDIDAVLNAIRPEDGNIAGFTAQADRPSRTCDPGWPHISWVPTSGSGVTNILVFPTIADREAVDQNFRSSGWTGIDGCSVQTYGEPWHWVAVDNVMVSTTSDALADQTRERLEGAAP